jgi:hypothetical protein
VEKLGRDAETVETSEHAISHIFVNNKSKNFLTTTTDMFTGPLYMGYRSKRPEEGRVQEVRQKLQEKYIDVSQLVEWPVDHSHQAECSTEEECSE